MVWHPSVTFGERFGAIFVPTGSGERLAECGARSNEVQRAGAAALWHGECWQR